MKLHGPRGEETIVTWGDHWPGCEECRAVEIERSATFANACAQGSPLLIEELAKRQAPVATQKRKEVEEWAKKAGVFKMGGSQSIPMKYVEDK